MKRETVLWGPQTVGRRVPEKAPVDASEILGEDLRRGSQWGRGILIWVAEDLVASQGLEDDFVLEKNCFGVPRAVAGKCVRWELQGFG